MPSSLSLAVKASFIPCLQQIPFFKAIYSACACHKQTAASLGKETAHVVGAAKCAMCGGVNILQACSSELEFKNFVPGSAVADQGDATRCIFLILSGRIDVIKQGSKCALLSLREGDHLGEETLLLNSRWSMSVIASEYTEVAVLSFSGLQRCLERTGALNRLGMECVDTWIESVAGGTAVAAAKLAVEQFNRQCKVVQTNMGKTQQKKKILDMLEKADIIDGSMVVMPSSYFRLIWGLVHMLGIVYYLLCTPLRVVQSLDYCPEDESLRHCFATWHWSQAFDYLMDGVMISTMVFHAFFFAFVQLESSVQRTITDHKLIFERFKSSYRCIVMLIVIVPVDLFAVEFGYVTCFRLSKLFSVLLLPGAVVDVGEYLRTYMLYTISSEAMTVLHLAYAAFFLCVWLASGWSIITYIDSTPFNFLDSVYFSLTTMTTVGYGDIVPRSTGETVFTIIACVLGPCMCATIIANSASFMKNDDTSENNLSHRKYVIQSLISSHYHRGVGAGTTAGAKHSLISRGNRLSDPLGAISGKDIRIASVDYFDLFSKTELSGMCDFSSEGTMISTHFSSHIKQHLIGDILQATELFSKASPFIVRKIISRMEPQYFSKGGLIIAAGEPSQYVYFVKNGTIQIYNQHGKRTQRLLQGDFFAPSSILPGYHVITYRATAFVASELWVLDRRDFLELAELYPEELGAEQIVHIAGLASRNTQRITDLLAPAIRALRHINNLREPNKTFVTPESRYYAAWCAVIVFVTLYNAFMIPLRVAFGEQSGFNVTFILDYAGDILLLVDICLNMWVVGFYDREDLVLVRDRIQDNYRRSGNFRYHFLSSLPLDSVCFFIWHYTRPSRLSLSQLLSLCRLNRLGRLVDVKTLVNRLERTLLKKRGNDHAVNDAEGLNITDFVRLAKLIFLVLLSTHVVGCCFFLLANEAHLSGNTDNWADTLGILRECSLGGDHGANGSCDDAPSLVLLFRQYIFALYWATATISTVGYGDVVAVSKSERIYNILVFLVGTSVYAMAVVHLQDIVAQLNVTSGLFKSRCDRITAFLQRENAPEHLYVKNKAYADKLWTACRGSSGREMKQFLPGHLYGPLALALVDNALHSLFFLKYCPPNFIHALASSMEAALYLPPDFIFFTHSCAAKLYVLTSGEIELVNESSGQRYAQVASRCVNGGGSFTLGETEFFQRSTYACSARVLQDTQCFEITFEAFWALVLEYKLELTYKAELEAHKVKLHKASTEFIVNALKGNLKNAKMAKLVSINQQTADAPNFFLLPNSPFCQVWTLLTVGIIFFWALTVPYHVAFEEVRSSVVFADIFGSIFFCIDIYFNLAYFAIEQNGELITLATDFRAIYIERKLVSDLISSAPISLIVLGMTNNYLIYVIIRCFHLLKLGQLSCKFHSLISFIEPLLGVRVPENMLRVIKTITIVWYFGHVICCIFYFIGKQEDGNSASWLHDNRVSDESELTKYLWCYLWSMYTVVTVGYGSVAISSSEERILAIVTMISGAILCDAGVAAVLSTMIDAQDRQSGVVKRQFDGVDAFCTNHSRIISIELAKTTMGYFNYLSQSLGDHDETSDVSILPPVIWAEIVRRISFRSLCGIKFIKTPNAELKLGFVNSLLRSGEPYIAHPGQVLGSETDPSSPSVGDLLILRRGKVIAMGASSSVTPQLKRRASLRSIESAISDEEDDDSCAGPNADKEYLHRGGVIYDEEAKERRASTSNGKVNGDIPLAKSVFVTIESVSDLQHRACQYIPAATTGSGWPVFEGTHQDGCATKGGDFPPKAMTSKPVLENLLSQVNSFMSGRVSSYIRLSCGAQKARTTTEMKKGQNAHWFPRKSSGGGEVADAMAADITWDQHFQFEVPADTNTLKMSLFLPAKSSSEPADRIIGTVSMDLDSHSQDPISEPRRASSGTDLAASSTKKSSSKDTLSSMGGGRSSKATHSSHAVLPAPTPPLLQQEECGDVHFFSPPLNSRAALQDNEYLDSVNETLHTIEFVEMEQIDKRHVPAIVKSYEPTGDIGNRCPFDIRNIRDEKQYQSSAAVGNAFVPNIQYNSFTIPDKTPLGHLKTGTDVSDISQDIMNGGSDSQDGSIHINNAGADRERESSANTSPPKFRRVSDAAKKWKRRDTLSFKTRSMVLDMRNAEGMYIGKVHFKVSVRASTSDAKKREKVKRLLGAGENVARDEGKYFCESFCHFLRIPKSRIEELQAYYSAIDLSVDARIDNLIAQEKEKESAYKPRTKSTLTLPEKDKEDPSEKSEFKSPSNSGDSVHPNAKLKDLVRAKMAPINALLSGVRKSRQIPKKEIEAVRSLPSAGAIVASSSIVQSRRRSSISFATNAKHMPCENGESVSISISYGAVPPTDNHSGICACTNEADAFKFRAEMDKKAREKLLLMVV